MNGERLATGDQTLPERVDGAATVPEVVIPQQSELPFQLDATTAVTTSSDLEYRQLNDGLHQTAPRDGSQNVAQMVMSLRTICSQRCDDQIET